MFIKQRPDLFHFRNISIVLLRKELRRHRSNFVPYSELVFSEAIIFWRLSKNPPQTIWSRKSWNSSWCHYSVFICQPLFNVFGYIRWSVCPVKLCLIILTIKLQLFAKLSNYQLFALYRYLLVYSNVVPLKLSAVLLWLIVFALDTLNFFNLIWIKIMLIHEGF